MGVLIVKRNKSKLKVKLFGDGLFGLNKTLVQNWAESRFSAITLIRIKNKKEIIRIKLWVEFCTRNEISKHPPILLRTLEYLHDNHNALQRKWSNVPFAN